MLHPHNAVTAMLFFAMVVAGCSPTARPSPTPTPIQENASAPGAQTAALGTPLVMSPGQEARFTGTSHTLLRLRFIGVSQDSRCPSDVQCIWAGEAALDFDARVGDGASERVSAKFGPSGDSVGIGGYVLHFGELQPGPVSTQKIAPQDYRLTLTVTEA